MNASAPPRAGVEPRRALGPLLRSVVKIVCVSDAPDYEQPWQSEGATTNTGSGAIIETTRGLRVLTNAHCVANHVFVELRRYGKAQKFEAKVEAIGHECDLALLDVADESFFAGASPLPIGELPDLSDRVSVCGYPLGGERLSITEGIVSRIELVSYAQSNRELLAVQIDAAINAGNSGGPVIADGHLVGVAFQALDEADAVGYMIAPEVVAHFLQDVDDSIYDGFPALGVVTQPLESRAHRRHLALPDGVHDGVLVSQVVFESSAWGVLEPSDVLLAVDGVPITADGSVVLREGELINFHYVVSKRHVGDSMSLVVWRRGQRLTLTVDLEAPRYLVLEDQYDVRPSYFIYGGLLFVPLSRDYLKTWGESWWHSAPRELVALYESGVPSPERTEVVVMQKVLADRVNQGYHDVQNVVIERVDGRRVRSLAHLVAMVDRENANPFIQFDTSDGEQLVLDRAEVRLRQAPILERFGVPHDRAPQLRLPVPAPFQPSSAPVAPLAAG